jgi:murein DD-endopeptidase MepM/ murein hydrolase activator NlpD
MKALLGICLVCMPLHDLHINSGYGYRVHPVSRQYVWHAGIDLRARHDTVFAIMNGIVRQAAYDPGLGFYVELGHGEVESVYGHLSRILVYRLDSVTAGQPIAITGTTGRVTGEHLHFSIRYHKKPVNPIQFLYELLIKNQHEQKFQSTSGAACRQADRGNPGG